LGQWLINRSSIFTQIRATIAVDVRSNSFAFRISGRTVVARKTS
jgi:hypothetical protein